jgi:outer membrane protein assembly factor BamB
MAAIVAVASATWAQGPGGTPAYPANIFSAAPRELRQYLTRAEAAIAEERFSDAVQELGEILNKSDSDDFFLGTPGTADTQPSLKTQALALLGSMPAKGRKFYELQYGADAKQALEEALNAGDLGKLMEVSRRYFHTKAGYEATLLLGRIQLDQGRPLAAALTLKRVADVPYAAAQYDPELSVLLATCWVYANQNVTAKETLLALKERMPQAKIKLMDKEVALYSRDEEAITWLKSLMGGVRASSALAASQWVVYRGDERRNAESAGGVPLLNFAWKVPTVNDPPDELRVGQRYRSVRDRGEPLICSLQPLVVQGYAILRQPETNKLVGFNLKKDGKREWVYPSVDDSLGNQTIKQTPPQSRNPTSTARDEELKQRVWEDNTFGQISSDGRQVYVIDDLGYAEMPNVSQPRVNIVRGGRAIFNNSGAKPYNLLVALDLAKQGYSQWAVGGTTGDIPALAGAFFLGPPLPFGDQLYALAEFNGEIRLVCLNPRNGALEWKQQLAILEEQLHIVNDRSRRLAGASPSMADGILVCPTSAGAVIAVDLATRTLRWGYQYGRSDVTLQTPSRFGARMPFPTNENGRWLDATATIADGCVVLTPVESQQLHCLDLLTGKAVWQPQPRDDMLFVGCIHAGKIILIGKDRAKAVKLADGTAAWKGDLKLAGESCTGRGYHSGKYYYLPVTGQQLLKIDLDEGTILAQAQTEIDLGNLVCYQDQLISQSPLHVASFVLLSEHLQKQLDERLAANKSDVEAVSLKAQILLQEGKATESLDLLRRASKLAPQSITVKGLLVKVMLALLRQDFDSHFALTDELDKLVSDPAQRREVLRWRVQGLARANRSWEAFQALMELADQELAAAGAGAGGGELQTIDRELAVRFDRWLQGQLYSLAHAADSELASRMTTELKTRLERTIAAGNVNQLRMLLSLFGFHEAAQPARLALAEKLIGGDGWLEAELLVGELLTASDRNVAASARATLAALYEKAKRPELAVRQYQALAMLFGDVNCRDGLTGKALAKRASENASLKDHWTAQWLYGQVETKESEVSGGADLRLAFQARLTFSVPISEFAGAAPRGLRATHDPQQQLVTVRGDFGQTLATASLRANNNNRVFYAVPNSNSLAAKANGHLVVVNLGPEVVAVDALRASRGGEALLWRQDAVDIDPNLQRNIYPQQRASTNPLVGSRFVSYDPNGKLNYNLAQVRGVGFCFQRGRQLICIDPITGQSLWERSPVPPQAEIFGDDELVFVADAKGEETLVLRAIDGALIKKCKIDPAERRWATSGRRVLAWQPAGNAIKVSLYDAWAGGNDLWSRQVAQGSRGGIIDGEEVAILEPGGQFTVVSLATGEVRFAAPLVAEPALAWIQVLRSRDQYLLLASQEVEQTNGILVQPLSNAGSQQTRMHGRVYAFSRATGKLQWPVPAFVAQHCLPAEQPAESPFLIFVRNRMDASRGNGPTKASVLALDRRDGRVVYDGDVCPTPAASCDIFADPTKQLVNMTLFPQSNATKTVAFHLTDKPIAPQPPAQTGAMASDAAGRPAGAVDTTVGAAVDFLKRNLLPPGR